MLSPLPPRRAKPAKPDSPRLASRVGTDRDDDIVLAPASDHFHLLRNVKHVKELIAFKLLERQNVSTRKATYGKSSLFDLSFPEA